jgi:hypothetical protein
VTTPATHRLAEFEAHFAQGKTIHEVAAAMSVSIYQATYARRQLRMPTKGVVGNRGGRRGRAQIVRIRVR